MKPKQRSVVIKKWCKDIKRFLFNDEEEKAQELLDRIAININNIRDEVGNNLLHYAANANSPIIVAYLIENGCKVNVRNSKKHCPLAIAVRRKNKQVARLLLEAGAIHSHNYFRGKFGPLHIACKKQDEDMVELLLQHGCNVNACAPYRQRPLHAAIPEFRFIINERIVELLIKSGAKINAGTAFYHETAFHQAVRRGCNERIVDLFLNNGSSVNSVGIQKRTPLFDAVECCNVECVRKIIEAGGQIHKLDDTGRNVFHKAVEWRKPEMVQLLLDYGARIDEPDRDDLDPLSISLDTTFYKMRKRVEIKKCLSNVFECIKILLSRGANVNRRNRNGSTPLRIAFRNRMDARIVQYLLDNGAKFDFTYIEVKRITDDLGCDLAHRSALVKHIALCRESNDSHNSRCYDLLSENWRKHCDSCVEELELMKQSFRVGSMSLYKLLRGKVVGSYAKNDSLVAAFESYRLKFDFPIYENMLYNRFIEEKTRIDLVPGATLGLARILNVPYDSFPTIFDTIVYYLSKQDLCNLKLV